MPSQPINLEQEPPSVPSQTTSGTPLARQRHDPSGSELLIPQDEIMSEDGYESDQESQSSSSSRSSGLEDAYVPNSDKTQNEDIRKTPDISPPITGKRKNPDDPELSDENNEKPHFIKRNPLKQKETRLTGDVRDTLRSKTG
ncbi:hypothetical protein M378DRAFT_17721 [Amanita muscaria Koide BX008]|uniref:Uncharacterized protein n=1 Tax=Amanita muscaria (strain Koide BX008) TaxID=946122 RepID=A0A0C2RZ90_AMAMK|nr:hypothetical protein M378DRAFT_17721 [Amanita muscaria Koide BX008]